VTSGQEVMEVVWVEEVVTVTASIASKMTAPVTKRSHKHRHVGARAGHL
jgi:hypothetical protein